jgi:hypothetical protein
MYVTRGVPVAFLLLFPSTLLRVFKHPVAGIKIKNRVGKTTGR